MCIKHIIQISETYMLFSNDKNRLLLMKANIVGFANGL